MPGLTAQPINSTALVGLPPPVLLLVLGVVGYGAS
jgi:hypothetical protein